MAYSSRFWPRRGGFFGFLASGDKGRLFFGSSIAAPGHVTSKSSSKSSENINKKIGRTYLNLY